MGRSRRDFTGDHMLEELTDRQREVFDFIAAGCLKGVPPTVRGICGQIGCTSPNAVAYTLRAIERKGWIVRAPGTARGFRLTKAARDSLRMPLLDVAARRPRRLELDGGGLVSRVPAGEFAERVVLTPIAAPAAESE